MPGGYTKIPNDLFDIIPDLTGAELKIVLLIYRATIGYHKQKARFSYREIAELTGLQRGTVVTSMAALQEKHIVLKYSDGQKKSEYQIILESGTKIIPIDGTKIVPVVRENHTDNGTKIVPQSPALKKKENIKERDVVDIPDEPVIAEENTRPNIYRVFEQEIGALTPSIADALEDAVDEFTEPWVVDALKECAARGARNWKYAHAILKNWKASGRREKKPAQPEPNTNQPTEDGGYYV